MQIKEYTQLWSLDLKWQLFFYIALFTGARRGEIVSLLWSDIDFSLNTIHFSKSTAVVKGEVIHKDTKTYATRQCIVPDIVIAAAKKLMHEQQEACLRLGDYWKGSRGKQFQNNFVFAVTMLCASLKNAKPGSLGTLFLLALCGGCIWRADAYLQPQNGV